MVDYHFMKSHEAERVSQLALRVFNQCITPASNAAGVRVFHRYIRPEALLARSLNDHCILVADNEKDIVGMIEVRDYHHLALFFVDTEAQGQGIGTTLWQKAHQLCKQHSPNLRQITVNASAYATPVYEHFGFQAIGPHQVHQGIRFTPMAISLS